MVAGMPAMQQSEFPAAKPSSNFEVANFEIAIFAIPIGPGAELGHKPSDQQQPRRFLRKMRAEGPASDSATGQKQGEQPSESRTAAELAQDQQKLRAELGKLRERLENLTAAGAAARDQARQAD